MAKKNKGGFPWFKTKKSVGLPVVRSVSDIQMDYNNACTQLGNLVYRARLSQAEGQQNEQRSQEILKRMFEISEEMGKALEIQKTNPPQTPAPSPSEGEGIEEKKP